MSDDGSVIDDVSYEAQGCSISQASISVMTDLVIGQRAGRGRSPSQDAFLKMHAVARRRRHRTKTCCEDAVAFAGVAQYPARVKCALLGWMAWKDALAQAGGSLKRPR